MVSYICKEKEKIMKIYMIYSKEMRGYVTQSRNGHDRTACFSTPERAFLFLKNVYEKGISDYYGKVGKTIIFTNILDKDIRYLYEIEEVEIDDFCRK